jgi:hypothetical protein
VAAEHERPDVDTRRVLTGGALVLGAVLFALLATWLDVTLLGGTRPKARIEQIQTAPPHLEPRPLEDFARHRAQEQSKLSSYRWVDRKAGVVQIPIDEAMALLSTQRRSQSSTPDSDRAGESRKP